MKNKMINDANDKAGAIAVGTGVIALARIISGKTSGLEPEQFLDQCENLAKAYIERLIKAEKAK